MAQLQELCHDNHEYHMKVRMANFLLYTLSFTPQGHKAKLTGIHGCLQSVPQNGRRKFLSL